MISWATFSLKDVINKTSIVLTGLLFSFITFIYFYQIGSNPSGLFCDEAQIGLAGLEIFTKTNKVFVWPFFYHHLGSYTVGALAPIMTAPFVAIFGLDDWVVRLAGASSIVAGLAVLGMILKMTKFKLWRGIILLTAVTPLLYHIGRIGFGHSQSFLTVFIGIYFYILAKNKNPFISSVLSGLFFGLSTYGYGSFVISTSLLLGCLWLSEIIFNKPTLRKYLGVTITSIIFMLMISPIFYKYATDKNVAVRLAQKNEGKAPMLSIQKINEIALNYPKYFSKKFLFDEGELGMPGAGISRHFIRNSGPYYYVEAALFALAILGLWFLPRQQKQLVLPSLVYFFLHPLPDALTTSIKNAPYTFALFNGMLATPFIIAGGIQTITTLLYSKRMLTKSIGWIALFLIVFSSADEARHFFKKYQEYPTYSTDFYGWQWGSREIINYYRNLNEPYDDLFLPSQFNAPEIFIPFYNHDGKCKACKLGAFDRLDPNRRQLFADAPYRIEEYRKRSNVNIKKIFRYPNGNEAFYIIETIK